MANSIPEPRLPQVFLTNQSADIYKLLSTLGSEQTPDSFGPFWRSANETAGTFCSLLAPH